MTKGVQKRLPAWEYPTRLIEKAGIKGQSLLGMAEETMREFIRKSCLMAVDYSVSNIPFRGLIKNVSPNGVYIETHGTFPAGRDITIAFSPPIGKGPVKASGRIVRSVQRGIGVALDKENKNLRTLVESLG